MTAVSSRIRAPRGVLTNIHGGLTDIYAYMRRLCEYSRFLHGFRGGTTVITLSTVLIRCVDGSGTAEGHGNLRQSYGTAAVVVHFNAAFFGVICIQQLKLDNMQSEDVDTLFPQSNRTQLLRRCVIEFLALTAGAAMVIVRTKRQKEAELAARERRSMKHSLTHCCA